MRTGLTFQIIRASLFAVICGTWIQAEGQNYGDLSNPTPSADNPSELTKKAEQIILDKCGECHTEFVLKNYIDQAFTPLNFEDVATSRALQLMREGHMPRKSGDEPLNPLTGAERDTLEQFAGQLAQIKGTKLAQNPRGILSRSEQTRKALEFLRANKDGNTKHTRFISILNLYNNQTLSEEDLEMARQAMIKALNSLASSRSAQPVGLPDSQAALKLIAVDLERTLYALDLRHFGWADKRFDFGSTRSDNLLVDDVANLDPFRPQGEPDISDEFHNMTGTSYPIVNAEMLALVATQSPLYDQLTDHPGSLRELREQLGIGGSKQESSFDTIVYETSKQDRTARLEWVDSLKRSPDPIEFLENNKEKLRTPELFKNVANWERLVEFAESMKSGAPRSQRERLEKEALAQPVMYAITTDSGVSPSGFRAVSRIALPTGGALWQSYDFKSDPRFERTPLPPGFDILLSSYSPPLTFKPDASEIIYSTGTGVMKYMIVDSANKSIGTAETAVVKDFRQSASAVINAQSCIACHNPGFKPFQSTENATILGLGNFSEDDKKYIRSFLVAESEIQEQIVRDTDKIKDVLTEIGVDPNTTSDPVFAILINPLLSRNLTVDQVAAQFGLTAEDLEKIISEKNNPQLNKLAQDLKLGRVSFRDLAPRYSEYGQMLGIEPLIPAPTQVFLPTNGGNERPQFATIRAEVFSDGSDANLYATPSKYFSVLAGNVNDVTIGETIVKINERLDSDGRTTLSEVLGYKPVPNHTYRVVVHDTNVSIEDVSNRNSKFSSVQIKISEQMTNPNPPLAQAPDLTPAPQTPSARTPNEIAKKKDKPSAKKSLKKSKPSAKTLAKNQRKRPSLERSGATTRPRHTYPNPNEAIAGAPRIPNSGIMPNP